MGKALDRLKKSVSMKPARRAVELPDGSEFDVEYHVPTDEGIHSPEWDELILDENEAPFAGVEED